jgi:hypothetical protein
MAIVARWKDAGVTKRGKNAIAHISSSYLRRDIGFAVRRRRNFVPQRFPSASRSWKRIFRIYAGHVHSRAYLAFMKHQMNNVFGGVLAFYLVTTAWATARRRDGETGIFDWGALLFALAVGAGIMTYGFEVANSPTWSKDGIPAGMYFFLGSVALLSAAGDVRMLVGGGVFGVHRIKTNVLFLQSILPLMLMTFWLFRVRFTNAYKRNSMPRGGDVYSLRT